MKSIRDLYKIGRGPSSSHTMGPERICKLFKKKNPSAEKYRVILYGSLAKTGAGHGTDIVVYDILGEENCDIIFDCETKCMHHPNTMDLFAYNDEEQIDYMRAYSVGGGRIEVEGMPAEEEPEIYDQQSFSEIVQYCKSKHINLHQYTEEQEGADIRQYLQMIWDAMKKCIETGLWAEGVLPGGLGLQRKAKHLFVQLHMDESALTKENRIVCAYAFAVSEQNAGGGEVVTAPTCGSAGVLPAALYYYQTQRGFSDSEIIDALETGGVIGNLIKTNASISGAECGCQAEIGSACAMAAAALGQLLGLTMEQIECAAEIAIEHHLGLTCDPVCGLVQIPCIERNAVAAMRAINAVTLANFLSDTRKISLDKAIKTMRETGIDISSRYKETSEGGLAKNWKSV